MTTATTPASATFGLFEKRIEGDDALMQLARLRFRHGRMGAEMHAGTPAHLGWSMTFRPSIEAPIMVHLPRDFDIREEASRTRIVDFASNFAGQICGLVLHDHADMALRALEFRHAAQELDSHLKSIEPCPTIFIEYAAGLDPKLFCRFFDSIQALPRISACIDIGHVGIQQVRNVYASLYPGQDICSLRMKTGMLPQVIADVQNSVATALPQVLALIGDLGALGKPLHFHLHDGHPLSTFSPFGVSDHLSFFAQIPIEFEFRGRR